MVLVPVMPANLFGPFEVFERREEEEDDRVALDVPVSDLSFMESYATHRNKVAKALGRKPKWTRKSVAEAFLSAHARAMRVVQERLTEEVGEPPSDPKRLADWARRVEEWERRFFAAATATEK